MRSRLLRLAAAAGFMLAREGALACPWGMAASTSRFAVADNSKPVVCPAIYLPVCARTRSGELKTYGNDCEARRDGATEIVKGKCASPG